MNHNFAVLIKETPHQKQLLGVISPTATLLDKNITVKTNGLTNYLIFSNTVSSVLEVLRLLQPLYQVFNPQSAHKSAKSFSSSPSSVPYAQQIGCYKYPVLAERRGINPRDALWKKDLGRIVMATITIYFLNTAEKYFICKNMDAFEFGSSRYDDRVMAFKHFDYFALN